MHRRVLPPMLVLIVALSMIASFVVPVAAAPAAQGPEVTPAGVFRGVSTAVKFDVSPPLSSITPLAPQDGKPFEIPERGTGLEGALGPQDADAALQTTYGPSLIPAPSVSFNGPGNISGVSPPDPVGDVGPNHYVAMSNLSFQIFNKTGGSLYGPALNNTLWAGFGGDCQTDNSGDPIVLYDQISDRWMLSQFTASGPTFFNCVAVSQTPDPTGAYYRWAFSTGANFPDYPKYGFWSDAMYISTREFQGSGGPFVGVGAYAVNRAQLIAGNPAAQVLSFLVPPGAAAYNIGDGLLPSDLDGSTLPPAGTPNFFMGAMDNGASYGAPQDALTLWKFTADFTTPANSTFVLANTIPISPYDTIPAFCSGRSCVPQPSTANKIDHLGYRQRPMHRLAYRNFGTHQSLVTNQSVEASATMSGIRWWEIRSPNSSPVLYQDATYAPGLTDGIHRWMGSIAMDSAGNMALGYSASNGTTTFPSVWYTGRLAGDPVNTMPQGEGSIINGTGSQTGSQRWGDYTSMNVDPVDDCTFWYVNEWVPTTSSVGWQLRIGAFKFNECGTADFTLAVTPTSQEICVGAPASYNVNVGSVSGYNSPVTLSASGNPGTAGFSVNPVTPPGSSAMTISGAAAGTYNFNVVGTAAGPNVKQVPAGLTVQAAAPGAPTLTAPANGALNVPAAPTFTWNAVAGATTYSIQVATDAGFTNIVASATGLTGTSWSGASLNTNTMYYWRVQATNACGTGTYSSVFSFSTVAAPGDCAAGTVPNILYQYGFESGASGWTSSGTGDTWAIATVNPHTGTSHYRALDPAAVSDQRLASPAVALPTGQNPVVLKFWHLPNLENITAGGCYDGGILEVSTDAGATWTQVPAANLLAGPYTGAVSATFGNPLAGLQAWCGATSYFNTIADVSAYAGQTAQFRMRLGSDTSVSDTGWDVDDVTVQSCQPAAVDPNIDVSPLSMSATQATNTTTQQTLTVANTGGGTLNWQIAEDNNPAPPLKPMPVVVPVAAPASEQVDAAAPAAPAQTEKAPTLWQRPEIVLYDNGPLVTHPGGGAGGADASAVQTNLGMSTNGFGVQLTAGNRLADDFTISDPNGWTIDTITLFLYQSNSTTTSPITAVNLQIWDGSPDLGTSTVVFGDTTTNRLASTSWANMYRVPITGLTGTARPIMANVVTVGTHLAPGTYWVDWQADGDAGLTGPWNPPITILGQTSTGNALQYTGAWAPIADVGSATPQGLPFIVNGIVGYPPACVTPNAIPWLSLNPTSGSNAGSTNTPVQVTFDSTGLTVGTYTASLCVTSNDPDPGSGNGTDQVIVPITLTVQTPTAVTLGSLVANANQSPMPAAIPAGALPAAAGLAMAAVYALRRRR